MKEQANRLVFTLVKSLKLRKYMYEDGVQFLKYINLCFHLISLIQHHPGQASQIRKKEMETQKLFLVLKVQKYFPFCLFFLHYTL